jgi:hypothetical protein
MVDNQVFRPIKILLGENSPSDANLTIKLIAPTYL